MYRLHIPKEVLIPLKKTDLSKAKELSTRPYFKSQAGWQNEVGTCNLKVIYMYLQCYFIRLNCNINACMIMYFVTKNCRTPLEGRVLLWLIRIKWKWLNMVNYF